MSSKLFLRKQNDRRPLVDESPRHSDNPTEVNTDRSIDTSSSSPRMVRVCTMCGRYKGLRSIRKLSRPSFY